MSDLDAFSALEPMLGVPGERPAVIVGNTSLSYSELLAAANRKADGLRAIRIGPGTSVVVMAHATIETFVNLVAVALTGATAVPVSAAIGEREMAHLTTVSRPAWALGSVPPSLHSSLMLRVATGTETVGGPMLLLFTSGTTGPPKGVPITTAAIAANLDALADAFAWTAEHVVTHALPLFHVHGLVLGFYGVLRRGGTLHYAPKFDAAEVAAMLGPRSILFGVPTMHHRLLNLAETDESARRSLSNAARLVSGSAGLPVREHSRAERILERGILERYGLTETLIVTSVRHGHREPGHVGRPLNGVSVALRPIEGAEEGTGEVLVRGPNVFTGYEGVADRSMFSTHDGHEWFCTGDVAQSLDGSLKIIGRTSTDLIKTGGYRVGAGEIEAALLEHANVAEVAVVGVPDSDLGERIEAFVVLAKGTTSNEAELLEHVAGFVSNHKRPRKIHFALSLPRNAMGKIQKAKLSGTKSS